MKNSGLRLAVTLALCGVAIIAVAVLTVSPQNSKLAQQAELLQQTASQLKLRESLDDDSSNSTGSNSTSSDDGTTAASSPSPTSSATNKVCGD